MRSLAGSLADDVLADAILSPPRPPTNIRKGRGPRKEKLVTQKPFTSKCKNEI